MDPFDNQRYERDTISEEEYRRQQSNREKSRQKKRNKKLALLGACLLAFILLIVCIVMIVKEITGGGKKAPPDATNTSSISTTDSNALDGVGGEGEEIPDEEVYPPPKAADPSAWYLKIVNENAPLAADFDPGEMRNISPAGHLFLADTASYVESMFNTCNGVQGNQLRYLSGYRSYSNQEQRYNKGELTDRAGTSEHQLGLAVDFVTESFQYRNVDFDKTPEFAWLMENAHLYGFILRYPADKTHITGIEYKPWHWRYVGVDDATIMKVGNVCLEEYVGFDSTSPPQVSDEGGEADVVTTSPGNLGY